MKTRGRCRFENRTVSPMQYSKLSTEYWDCSRNIKRLGTRFQALSLPRFSSTRTWETALRKPTSESMRRVWDDWKQTACTLEFRMIDWHSPRARLRSNMMQSQLWPPGAGFCADTKTSWLTTVCRQQFMPGTKSTSGLRRCFDHSIRLAAI